MTDSEPKMSLFSDYEERRSFTRRLVWHKSLDPAMVERLWRSPDELMSCGEALQDKERCLVIKLSDGPEHVVMKRHNWGGPWKTLCKSLRTPQARQSFLDGAFLLENGVRTPKPLALVEQRWGPLGRQSYLISEYVRGTSLYRLMRYEQPPQDLGEHLIDQIIDLCHKFDALKVSHNDLKAENLMIDPAGRVWVIDLEKMRRHTSAEPARVRLLEDLKRLLHPRSWRGSGDFAISLRNRFLEEVIVKESLAKNSVAKHPLLEADALFHGDENKLSVLIALSSGPNDLQACIESVRDIADEIAVADFRPAAESKEITEKHGGHYFEKMDSTEDALTFRSRVAAALKGPWILAVEGEEVVSPDLAKEIQCVLSDQPQAGAYRIGRRRVYLGHVSKFGVFRNEMPIRLFHKEVGQFVACRLRSRVATTDGSVGKLKSKLIYHLCWHVADFVRSMNQNTSRVAKIRFEQGQQPKVLIALLRASRRFAKNFLWKHGYLDGLVGLQISLLSAFAVIVTEAKLWELRHSRARRGSSGANVASPVTLFRNATQPIAGASTGSLAATSHDLVIQPDSCPESQHTRAAS